MPLIILSETAICNDALVFYNVYCSLELLEENIFRLRLEVKSKKEQRKDKLTFHFECGGNELRRMRVGLTFVDAFILQSESGYLD